MSFFRSSTLDIGIATDNDLLIEDGDFVIEESDQRHIDDILASGKGNWREWPLLGVEIERYLNSTGGVTDRIGLLRTIRLQLEYDNFKVDEVNVVQGSGEEMQLKIQAKRKR